ncbi:MAG: response regulator [Alphaproteobacteria bacterium]|nr:response regulator [Alphaproteobacteria bacterium]
MTAADIQPHVLVVDDDTRLRDLLRQYLAKNGYRVTAVANAAEARERMAALAFDLVVLDVTMPGEDGISFTRSLRGSMTVPILLLTARGEANDRIAGLEAGADDYLAKPFEPRELLLRAAAVLRRVQKPAAALEALQLGEFAFDVGRGELSKNGAPVRLTSAETALLKLLGSNARTLLSRTGIVQGLTEAGASVAERSVDVHIARLRRKIEPDPRNPRYLKTVWGGGYVLWPD